MKTILNKITLLFIMLLTINVYGQAKKKPSLIIIPDNNWMTKNKYYTEVDNQGSSVKKFDFQQALDENFEVGQAIAILEKFFNDRNFPAKNLGQTLATLQKDKMRNNQLTSRDSGNSIFVSAEDELNSVAKADIVVKFTWDLDERGFDEQLTYRLVGYDSYTDMSVGVGEGTGPVTSRAPLSLMVKQAIGDKMDAFLDQLGRHIEDMEINGRRVTVAVKTWDDADNGIETYLTDYIGEEEEELGILIEDWMYDNTVAESFNLTDATDTQMKFEEVRIPLFTERKGRQRALDTRSFVNNLKKYLKSTFDIESSVMMEGLGKATLMIGSK